MRRPARIGCAGWNVHAFAAAHFPETGSHLERYAAVFDAVEINSSFYREHRVATYERWARTVPPSFRFSLKIPKKITHERRLADTGELLDRFLAGPAALGERVGPLIVQLPPSLALDAGIAEDFFAGFRDRWSGAVACEPRHVTWFTAEADALLTRHGIGRVAADPPRAAGGEKPGGSADLVYYRLHGSPRIYYSAYAEAYLAGIAAELASASGDVWCIFDNTALGAAAGDALTTRRLLGPG